MGIQRSDCSRGHEPASFGVAIRQRTSSAFLASRGHYNNALAPSLDLSYGLSTIQSHFIAATRSLETITPGLQHDEAESDQGHEKGHQGKSPRDLQLGLAPLHLDLGILRRRQGF